jgi:2,3-bisphosphoglycerate-dependent phosphoglycerate mutase
VQRLTLLRHARSLWNTENRFTGWTDIGLSEPGREEAALAGASLRENGYRFDRAFVSTLRRSGETLDIVLRELGQVDLRVERNWRLNERHYGALEGLDKTQFGVKYGADQLLRLRRGYRERPPALAHDDPRHPRQQPLYKGIDQDLLPDGESLADTRERVAAYWREMVAPAVLRGERVLVVSHGNTLRALLMHIEGLSEEAVVALEIPTGSPLAVDIDGSGRFIRRFYVGCPEDRATAV